MAEKTDHDLLVEMHTILCGNGNEGWGKKHDVLAKDVYNYRRKTLMIFCFLAGGGGLGVGIIELAKLIK